MKVFFDCETTGLDPLRNDIITGFFLLTDNNNNIIDELEIEVAPDRSYFTWSPAAEKIHGIKMETAYDFPPREKVIITILEFFDRNLNQRPSENIFIMQAYPYKFFGQDGQPSWPYFDWHFLFFMFYKENAEFLLRKYFTYNPKETTLTLWYKLKEYGLAKRNLESASQVVGYKFDHHNAKADTLCLFECWKWFEQALSSRDLYNDGKGNRKPNLGLPELPTELGMVENQYNGHL